MTGFDAMIAGVRGRRRVIGGGLVLDETGEGARLDIVVAGDTIEAIVPPSASADIGDVERIDASGFAIIPGPRQCAHPRPWRLEQGLRRPLDAGVVPLRWRLGRRQ